MKKQYCSYLTMNLKTVKLILTIITVKRLRSLGPITSSGILFFVISIYFLGVGPLLAKKSAGPSS